jgi:hypothetical protein
VDLKAIRASGESSSPRDEDGDLLAVLGLAWLVSAVRVAGALHSGRAFGVEATLALLLVVVAPLVALRHR